ncbi:TonB C-terminal domain-containing protein [Paracoccaceae bacterium]|nr:TonB C-terminal domain-containing protein [Paracoccaceae bacterium]
MRQGLYTSGFFHVLAGIVLIGNFEIKNNMPEKTIENINIQFLSDREFRDFTESKTSQPLKIEQTATEVPTFPKLGSKKNLDFISKNQFGNELKGISEPKIEKIEKRKILDEIITDRAMRGLENDKAKAQTKAVHYSKKETSENKILENNQTNKNSASQISSEGKNVAIVSGALKVTKIPPIKPNIFRVNKENLKSMKLKKEENILYGELVNKVVKEGTTKLKADGPLQNLAKARMLQILNDNWNVVSINRLPNYERYKITLEIRIDRSGKISGPIKVISPKKIIGNFKIAKRSAVNAVLESVPFPVPEETFPKGLILRVVFDPKTNVGVNNG